MEPSCFSCRGVSQYFRAVEGGDWQPSSSNSKLMVSACLELKNVIINRFWKRGRLYGGVDRYGVREPHPILFLYDLLAYTRCRCLYIQYTRTHTWGINQRLCCHGTPYLLIEACIHNMRLYKMNKWKTYINVKTSALAWKREWMNVSIYLKRWTK